MKIGEPKKYDSIPKAHQGSGRSTPLSKAMSALQIGEMLPVQLETPQERRRLYGCVACFAKNNGVRLVTRQNGDILEIYRVAKEA